MLKRLLVLGILLLFTVPVFAADEPVKKPDASPTPTVLNEAPGVHSLAVHVVETDKSKLETYMPLFMLVLMFANVVILVCVRSDLNKILELKSGGQ